VAAKGVDIKYVVLGHLDTGGLSDELDVEILKPILEAIETWAAERSKPTPIALKAELLRLFYQQYRRSGSVDGKHMQDHLRLVG